MFSEYYGTDNNFNNGMPELRDKKPVFNTIKIKSRDKSNSKLKLNLLSPPWESRSDACPQVKKLIFHFFYVSIALNDSITCLSIYTSTNK